VEPDASSTATVRLAEVLLTVALTAPPDVVIW
jgi:hypothetical protein